MAGDITMSFIAYKICAQAARGDTIESSMGQDLKSICRLFGKNCSTSSPFGFYCQSQQSNRNLCESIGGGSILQRHGDDEEMLIVLTKPTLSLCRRWITQMRWNI